MGTRQYIVKKKRGAFSVERRVRKEEVRIQEPGAKFVSRESYLVQTSVQRRAYKKQRTAWSAQKEVIVYSIEYLVKEIRGRSQRRYYHLKVIGKLVNRVTR